MSDKASLTEDVRTLSAAVAGAASAESAGAGSNGRLRFRAGGGTLSPELARYVLGGDLDLRYPAGPAFLPLPYAPSLLGLSLSLQPSDALSAAAGSAVAYGMAFSFGASPLLRHVRRW